MDHNYPRNDKMLNLKIQEILLKIFATERKYYETAQDIQITELSRYLYHQSAIRNRFGNELCEAMVVSGLVPNQNWIEKGKLKRSGLDEKAFLEDRNYSPLIQSCFMADEHLVNLCRKVFQDIELPIEILEVLTTCCTVLLFELSEGWDLFNEIGAAENGEYITDKKIIQLQPKMETYRKTN